MIRVNVHRSFVVAALVAATVFLGAGCSDGKKKLAKLSGVVTLDGKPLENATIVFHPVDGGRPATGVTGTDGQFTLSTYTTGDGAQVGSHKVVITKASNATVTPPPAGDDAKGVMEAMKAHDAKRKAEAAKPKQAVLPATYGDLAKTPLKCEVPVEGPLEFPLRSAGGS